MQSLINRLNVRSVIVVTLVFGVFFLAIYDKDFRPTFGDLAKVSIGGYFGQMNPGKRDE